MQGRHLGIPKPKCYRQFWCLSPEPSWKLWHPLSALTVFLLGVSFWCAEPVKESTIMEHIGFLVAYWELCPRMGAHFCCGEHPLGVPCM
jgi:hypothetical protein